MNGIKGYISIREASYRWGVSERRVNQYCAEGRIPGASRFGRSWAIPENAEKPSDPRFQEYISCILRNFRFYKNNINHSKSFNKGQIPV